MLTSVTDVPLESVTVRTLPPLTAMKKQTKYETVHIIKILCVRWCDKLWYLRNTTTTTIAATTRRNAAPPITDPTSRGSRFWICCECSSV